MKKTIKGVIVNVDLVPNFSLKYFREFYIHFQIYPERIEEERKNTLALIEDIKKIRYGTRAEIVFDTKE